MQEPRGREGMSEIAGRAGNGASTSNGRQSQMGNTAGLFHDSSSKMLYDNPPRRMIF